MINLSKKLSLFGALVLLSGCAHIELESPEETKLAKQIPTPPPGKSGLYFYRDSVMGYAVSRNIRVDDKCVGSSKNGTFFHVYVNGDIEHTLSTEGENRSKNISLKVDSGKNYFIEQFITWGVWEANSKIKVVPDEKGRKAIQDLKLATSGNCR